LHSRSQTYGEIRPYAPDAHDCLHGWLGNRALATGATWWRARRVSLSPKPSLLNACNARGLLLAFRDGDTPVPFHLLGTDGGLLTAPQQLERVFLYGGERVDVALDTAQRQSLAAVSLEFDSRHHAHGEAASHVHSSRAPYAPLAAASVCEGAPGAMAQDALPDGAALPLFRLRVRGSAARPAPPLPARLSALADDGAAQAPARRLRLDFDPRSGFLIDETPYRIDEPGWRVSRDSREVWEIKNSPISMPHAMHLHGFSFRVLRRQGTFGPARALATAAGGRLATDLGVKDTVVVWPNETVWLAVDFTLPRDPAFAGAQRFMFHCHNLEHEDGMMMRNLTVA